MSENPFDIFFKSGSNIDVAYTCPECYKQIGLEKRFVIPALPLEIECPYCKNKFMIKREDLEKERK